MTLPASGQITFTQINEELQNSTAAQADMDTMTGEAIGDATITNEPDNTADWYGYTHAFIPTAPGDVTTIMDSVISCEWSDDSSNEDGFRIQWSINGGGYGNTHTVGAGVQTATLPIPCVQFTTYRARVQSFNGTGNSAYVVSANEATGDGSCPS